MKILYATDLHGDKAKYEKLLDIAVLNDIKIIINGGDILSKTRNRHLEQPLFIKEYLSAYLKKLKKYNIKYLVMLGNDDLSVVDKLFDEVCNKYDNVYNMAGSKVNIDGYDFIGMNYILDHPFGCKDRVVMEDNYVFQRQYNPIALLSNDIDYDEITDWFEYAHTKLPKMKSILNKLPKSKDKDKTIYIMHMPPSNLKLGQLLYQDLDIGSNDIYNFIKDKQPLLTLHGHIHESPDTISGKWINYIGNTTCIQPGQSELNSDTMVYVNIDLESGEYIREVVGVAEPEN